MVVETTEALARVIVGCTESLIKHTPLVFLLSLSTGQHTYLTLEHTGEKKREEE